MSRKSSCSRCPSHRIMYLESEEISKQNDFENLKILVKVILFLINFSNVKEINIFSEVIMLQNKC